MENMTIPTTSRQSSAQVTSFGMPTRGCTFAGVRSILGIDSSVTASILRARPAGAAKGHVAFVAYVPGSHAWSPPIC